MYIKLLLEQKRSFLWTVDGYRVGRVLLYHTGADLSGYTSYPRDALTVRFVQVAGQYLYQGTSYNDVRNYTGAGGIFFQDGPWMYIRIYHASEGQSALSNSWPWFFNSKNFGFAVGFTNGDFFVSAGQPLYTSILSAYKLKISCDDKYGVPVFDRKTFDFIYEKVKNYADSFVGAIFDIELKETGQKLERQYIDNVTGDVNKITISSVDLRSSLKGNVIDQKFNENDFRTTIAGQNVSAVSPDVQKTYRKDAIGHCVGVPGTCVNGYAMNGDTTWRYYWFSYGSLIRIDNDILGRPMVEVKQEEGWVVIAGWEKYDKVFTLPNGLQTTVQLIRVPASVVHPPQPGYTTPDWECTPREVRVSGKFHAELETDGEVAYPIVKYLFQRYSSLPWNSNYFDDTELKDELLYLQGTSIGIVFDQPTKLYEAIAKIQGGGLYGWKLTTHNYLFTARVHYPYRATKFAIKHSDIKNILQLKYDLQANKYTSDGTIRYQKTWSEDNLWLEYKNEATRQAILATHSQDVANTEETLLYYRNDAVGRYNQLMRWGQVKIPKIEGIELNEKRFSDWLTLREYDIVTIDFSQYYPMLSGVSKWYVMGIEIDLSKESCKLTIRGV